MQRPARLVRLALVEVSAAAAAHACITVAVSPTGSTASLGTSSASWAANRAAVSSDTLATTAATCPPDTAPATHAPATTGAARRRRAVRVTTVACRLVIPALRRSHAVCDVSPSRSQSPAASNSATAIVTLAANRSCRCSTRVSAAGSAGISSSSIAAANTSNMAPPYAGGVTPTRPETLAAHRFQRTQADPRRALQHPGSPRVAASGEGPSSPRRRADEVDDGTEVDRRVRVDLEYRPATSHRFDHLVVPELVDGPAQVEVTRMTSRRPLPLPRGGDGPLAAAEQLDDPAGQVPQPRCRQRTVEGGLEHAADG